MSKPGDMRSDFPSLGDRGLVYLDSAATTLKPHAVIDAVTDYYSNYPANVFRGLYPLSMKASEAYENAREIVASFINASSPEEIVFTSGATGSINLVAYAWGRVNVKKGDHIATTIMEHHSNFIPWQMVAKETEAELRIVSLRDIEQCKWQTVNSKTKLVAITHVSNVLGTINPIKQIITDIKRANPRCLVLVDGAQAVPHMSVDVQDLGCDFYAFSGHKMLGPTGIGVLWARKEVLDGMGPFQTGGGMIESVSIGGSTYAPVPQKFEAGTPHIAGAIGLGAAIEYLRNIGMDHVEHYEHELAAYTLGRLQELKGVTINGPAGTEGRSAVISFNLHTDSGIFIHPHDVGEVLGRENICVRVGHHCAMPLHTALGIPASVRVSLYLYNTKADIDKLIGSLTKTIKLFR